jgi:hypothetical protein
MEASGPYWYLWPRPDGNGFGTAILFVCAMDCYECFKRLERHRHIDIYERKSRSVSKPLDEEGGALEGPINLLSSIYWKSD